MTRKKLSLLGIAILMFGSSAKAEKVDEMPVDTTFSLQEVTVLANFLSEKNTPLNLTTIAPADIRLHASAPNYVEMMQGIPGVYATASTGNYGDASLNMRGFKQENIAILLNGIPIQGLTSGSMYWSNWMGLADATHSIQIQKGLGGSMLADCAMGGLVNIITKRSEHHPLTQFGVTTNAWGTTKTTLNYSSGTLTNGWGVDLSLAYVGGHGFVECSDVSTFSYMLNISKVLTPQHTIMFMALGSPEQHDQRNTELSNDEVAQYGRDYSKNWGYLRGEKYSIARNHYFKPYFTLQHLFDSERLTMKNSLYLAIADGGGRSTYAASGAQSIIKHQTADGHIDFDAIVAENEASGAAKNMMIDYLSGHTQAGAIASAQLKLDDEWKLGSGLQYQYYDTWSKMKVLDLLGADHWYDYASKSKLYVGDMVGAAYGRTTHHASAYLQALYDSRRISANVGMTVFSGTYRRHNDITGDVSKWAHGWGMSAKAGVLYHLNNAHSLYLNAGYNSRLPYAGVYLASSDLSITNDVKNEENILGEMGWRAAWQGGGLELSGYVASWRNKTLTVSLSKRANEAAEKYQITGLNALHLGLELSAHQQLTPWLTAKAYAMTASWKWQNSGEAIIYDSFSGETLKQFAIYCDGLHVGDAPQTQLGAALDAKLMKGFYAHLGWQWNARMYADFEPSNRTSNDTADAYRLPAYSLLDATVGWEGTLYKSIRMNVFATVQNITNAKYIERGIDGTNHDLDSFRGYWGAPRCASLSMRLYF